MSIFIHPLQHIFERIVIDALDDQDVTVGTGGRTIACVRFADDIDGLQKRKNNW